MKKILTATK